MNPRRVQSLLDQQSMVAKKVYSCVPTEVPSPAGEISNAVMTSFGTSPGVHVVRGCLARLVDAGLVRERNGSFTRTPVRDVPADDDIIIMPTPIPPTEKATEVVSAEPIAIERLSKLGSALRELAAAAQNLHVKAMLAAEEADAIGVQVDDEVRQYSQSAEKLRQLQTLLRGIGA